MKTWKEHFWYTVPCMRTRIEEIVKRVNGAGKTIVEVGCNEGFLSKALMEDGGLVTSVDIDEERIAKAKDLFNIDVIKGDINCLPFAGEQFDVAVGGEVLEHIDNPARGFSELFRVAKEAVVISLPIGTYWLGEKEHLWWIDAAMVEHDSGALQTFDKTLLILKFNKRKESNGS